MKNWEKQLADLCKFTKEEGFDPDRFYSLIQTLLDKQREEIKKKVDNLYMHTNPFKAGDETDFYKNIIKDLNK